MRRKEELDALIDSYLSGKATPKEKALLEKAYDQAVRRSSTEKQFEPEIDRIGKESWAELAEKITPPSTIRVISWRKWLGVAASVLALVALTIFYNYRTNQINTTGSSRSVFVNDIDPGRRGATLTLGNGKRVDLISVSTDSLVHEAGVIIRKSDDGLITYEAIGSDVVDAWNTLTTDSGQTFRIKLSDGSLVVLNAASSLRYPTNLGRGGNRSVYLTGEAYFEVAADPSAPFTVDVRNQQITVLGTRFNVNGYKNEPDTRTVLIEGSVELQVGGLRHLLAPGQQAINDGAVVHVSEADTEQALDWINGEFALNGLDFRTAMRKIARWYHVDVVFDQSLPGDLQTGGWISRDTKLSEVLALIENSGQVYFRVENRHVYVMKK